MPNTNPPFEPEHYIAATAPLLSLTLEAGWMAPIAANLRVLAAAAALLTEFEIPDAVDAAPRFEA